MLDFATAIKAGKDGFQFVRDLRGALQRAEVQPTEIADRLLQIQELLLGLQAALGDAQSENRALKQQLESNKRLKDFGKDFTFEEGVYWFRDYPYCPNCWDVDRKPMRLNGPSISYTSGRSNFECALHKLNFDFKRREIWFF